jgi:nucleoside-diphosphate-sugar epimerase
VADISAYHPEDVELMLELFLGKIGHYIFASSTVIYAPSAILPITEDDPVDRGEDQIEYGMHKILCEDILLHEHRQRGFPATVVPFSMVFGPRNAILDREQRMFVRLLSGRPILIPGDGTALGQVGHVDDQARALRMLMGNPATFGKRYNVTGSQWFSDEGYVDTFAEVVGVEPRKVFIPADVMDDLWDGRLHLGEGRRTERIMDARPTPSAAQLQVMYGRRQPLAILVQKLAPNLHRWNSNVIFSIDRVRRDVGWEPEYTFRSMVEHTYGWFRDEGLHEVRRFDFTFEDQLLTHLSQTSSSGEA